MYSSSWAERREPESPFSITRLAVRANVNEPRSASHTLATPTFLGYMRLAKRVSRNPVLGGRRMPHLAAGAHEC